MAKKQPQQQKMAKKNSQKTTVFNDIKLTPIQQALHKKINENEITFVHGPAGTSKTFVGCYTGLKLLMADKVEQMILVKPVEESGERLGFLPGTIEDKLAPYFESFLHNMEKIMDPLVLGGLLQEGRIKQKPLAYMRGATFDNAIIVADECVPGDARIFTGYMEDHQKIKFMRAESIVKMFNKGKSPEVLSVDSAGVPSMKKVIAVFENGEKSVIKLHFANSGKPIETTTTHPISVYAPDGGITYKLAGDLVPGDQVMKVVTPGKQNARPVREGLDIILGFLLGDAALSKNKQKIPSYRLIKNHGLAQEEYCDFSRALLDGSWHDAKSGYTGNKICGFSTKSLVLPTDFIAALYSDGVKSIGKGVSEYFSARTLATWMMDDGYYSREGKEFVFCTHGFDRKSVEVLADILTSMFGLSCRITTDKNRNGGDKDYNVLRVNSTDKLFELTAGLIHPHFSYKVKTAYTEFKPGAYSVNFYDELTCAPFVKAEESRIVPVFNFEVEDNNNYCVDNILVHNCQNCDFRQLMLLISRMGKNTKIIIAGDISQYDIAENKVALPKFIKMISDVPGVSLHEFDKADIVRNPILIEITDRYEKWKHDHTMNNKFAK